MNKKDIKTVHFHKVIKFSGKEDCKNKLLDFVKSIEMYYFTEFNENLFPESIPLRSLKHEDIIEMQERCKKG